MAKIVVELTNRCNLKCHHCFSGRHGGKDDLPMAVLENIWENAKDAGFDLLSFTGGDPTLHENFAQILQGSADHDFGFGINTNGINFARIYPVFLKHRKHCKLITFSMDGGSEASHDQLRGKNSFRRLMQAISICVSEKIPFGINMVIAAHNKHELLQAVQLASSAGARGIRFCHLMHSPITTDMGLDLSPWERKLIDAQVAQLQRQESIRVEMAPGDYATDPFPCAPLAIEEINIDCAGNMSTCCHLSGHGPEAGNGDVIGSLLDHSFADLLDGLKVEHARFRKAKQAFFAGSDLRDTDFFSCWYCTNHYKKIDWLRQYDDHSWLPHIWDSADQGADVRASKVIPITAVGAPRGVKS